MMLDLVLPWFIASSFLGLGISFGPVYLSHVLLAGTLAVLVAELFRRRGKLVLPKPATNLHLFLAVMVGWYLFTALWSPNKLASLRYVFYLAYGSCITLAVVAYARTGRRLLGTVNVLLVLLGVEMAIALLEAFTPFRYPISPQSPLAVFFGREMLLQPWALSQRTLEVVTSYPTGFRWNPNNLATVLNLFMPFLLMRREYWLKLAGSLAVLIVVVMTSSKINLMAWLLVVILYAVFFSRRRGLYAAMLALGSALSLLSAPLAAEALAGRIPQSLNEALHTWEYVGRFFSEERYVGDSVTLRRRYLENGLAAIAASHGLGVGAGCAGEEAFQPGAVDPGAVRASLHNYWLEMAVDGGLVFAGIFWAWYAVLIKRLLRLRARSGEPTLSYLASASALSLIGLIVAAVGASSMVYEPALWLVYGISIAAVNLGVSPAG